MSDVFDNDDLSLDEIEKRLGTKVIIPIKNKDTEVILVDGEKQFDQPGMSAGFVHFADPDNPSHCLGFAGVNTVWRLIQ